LRDLLEIGHGIGHGLSSMIFETPPAVPPPDDRGGDRQTPPDTWSKVDLHLHTTASDGRLTPAELVHLAVERGLTVIALTDHDSTEGVEEGIEASRGTGLEVLPGVEINTDSAEGEAHVLGYFLEIHSEGLQACLSKRRRDRLDRGLGIVRKLLGIGIEIDWNRVQEIAGVAEGGAVGRPHIAQALMERGYVATTAEAFERYIGRDGPAYVEYAKLTPPDAIGVIHDAGGLAVLAHPLFIRAIDSFLPPLLEAGLDGLECYYGSYSTEQVAGLLAMAARYGLVPTGGSDFHGPEATSFSTTLGGTPVPLGVVAALRERHSRSRGR
jgi:3',5'-nucleoside bisphosphate phosphatase